MSKGPNDEGLIFETSEDGNSTCRADVRTSKVLCSQKYQRISAYPWCHTWKMFFPHAQIITTIFPAKNATGPAEDVEVLPTFDALGVKEDLLRGVYAYGPSFAVVGMEDGTCALLVTGFGKWI